MDADRDEPPTGGGPTDPSGDDHCPRLALELEPTVDGARRALVSPVADTHPSSGHWLAAPAALLVDLSEVR